MAKLSFVALTKAFAAANEGVSQAQAKQAAESLFDVITDAILAGDEVVTPVGKFSLANRPERMVRNPRTGETFQKEAGFKLKFGYAKPIKDAVAEMALPKATKRGAKAAAPAVKAPAKAAPAAKGKPGRPAKVAPAAVAAPAKGKPGRPAKAVAAPAPVAKGKVAAKAPARAVAKAPVRVPARAARR